MASNSTSKSPIVPPNILSRICLSWVFALLSRSRNTGTLQMKDVYDHPSRFHFRNLTDRLKAKWSKEQTRSSQHPNFIRVVLETMGFKLFLIGLLLILHESARIAQPILLIQLMHFFEPRSTMSTQSAWFFAGATVLSALCASFFYHTYFYLIQAFGIEMRNAHMNLIVQKILRLSMQSINTIGSGTINNLVSNDASQIEFTLLFLNYLWVAPLQLLIVTIIFWHYVKYIALIPAVYVSLILSVQILTSHFCNHFRSKISQAADSRLKRVNEIVKSMRVVKMFCLESIFTTQISKFRRREMAAHAHHSMVICGQKLLSHSFVPVTFLLMYIAMWLFNIPFNTQFFVVAICLLNYMRLSIIDFVNLAIQNFSKYLVASKRMQDFLTHNDFERDMRLSSECSSDTYDTEQSMDQNEQRTPLLTTNQTQSKKLRCNVKEAKWNQKNLPFALRDISFDAYPGDLVCIVGSVGSGKTTLLQTLLGEITCFDGELQLSGTVCYVPQEPWIFSATIKQNILFGADYDKQRFDRVLFATALDIDVRQFPDRHRTLVGDQGVMLSGGQKSRLDLARALYRNADIYLLDDPFSAVDTHVSAHIFDHVIKNYLKDKICVMVTHQVRFLKDATKIIVLENGNVSAIGKYDELHEIPSIARLLKSVKQHVQEDEELTVPFQTQQSVTESICSATSNEEQMASPRKSVETQQEGRVSLHVFAAYLRAGIGLLPGLILLFGLFSAQQGITIYSNWQLAMWSIHENNRHQISHTCKSMISQQTNPICNITNAQWSNQRDRHFFTYCGIVAVIIVISFLRIGVIDMMLLNAGRVLHNRMFQRIIHCPIHFFNSNRGQNLNRFSKDFSIIDNQLPNTFFDFFYCLFQVLGAVIFVSTLSPWSLLPAVLAALCMLIVRSYYAQGSRDLKRLEATSRSPIFSHLTSMLQGLQVIRSYRAEDTCLKEFYSYLDKNTHVKYSSIAAIQWAGIRFDWISLSFIALVTSFALALHTTNNNFSAINIALTLTYSLNLVGLFQWTIRQSVDVEAQMTAVERVLEYSSLEQEPQPQLSCNNKPSTDWPSRGEIKYENVSMKHLPDEGTPLALNNISFTIKGGEKVGIIGRTGAGKSSSILTLFRMGFITTGRVIIDGIDIATINLDDLRQRISIVPQDPVLFNETLRFNLDPFNHWSDEEIWNTLEKMELKTQIIGQMQNGLGSMIDENGSNMSVGQKQLVCLMRAILKKTKILVIDEGAANVDNETDATIQRTIRLYSENCTILIIAHRLDTIVDSDRILALGDGKLLEFDTPENLRANPKSYFSSLMNQMNSTRSNQLQTISEVDNTTTA